MKRFALYFGLATAMVASCSIQERDLKTLQQDDVVFYASFEQPTEEGTRVYANEDLLLRWTADDRVSIFNKLTYNQEYSFTGQTGANAGGFKKVDKDEFVTGNAISHVVSVYPYQESTAISESEEISLMLPAEQHYAENTFGLGANTMVSVSEDNVLQYKNVGGYLMLRLYGEGVSVSSIALKGNNGEKLAGKATVTMPLNGVPTVEMEDDAATEITLTCETPVTLGSNADNSTTFWFVVPPVTFEKGFTIQIKQAYGSSVKSTSKSITILRSTLSKMSPIMVDYIPEGSYVDEYGVNQGQGITIDGITWAPVNCGYKPETSGSKGYPYGKLYQYGRKDGQGYGAPYYNSSDPFEDETTPVIQAQWTGNNEDADANTFYWGSGSSYNWINKDDPFWNAGSEEVPQKNDLYDPCPDGWRVPTQVELSMLAYGNHSELVDFNGIKGFWYSGSATYKESLTEKVFLPACGGRFADNWAHRNGAVGRGDGGSYWTSSLSNSKEAIRFELAADSPIGSTYRAFGNAVRCCRDDGREIVLISEIMFEQTEMDILVGNTVQLHATVLPENATFKVVCWSSSDESVATVSDDGTVVALSEGEATITAASVDGQHQAACNLHVTSEPIPVTVSFAVSFPVLSPDDELAALEGDDKSYSYGILVQQYNPLTSSYEPYAEGVFDDLSKAELTMDKTRKYNVEAAVIDNFYNSGNEFQGATGFIYRITNSFIMNENVSLKEWLFHNVWGDAFYGMITDYTPSDSGTCEIGLENESAGIKIEVEGADKGTVKLSFNQNFMTPLSFSLEEQDGISTYLAFDKWFGNGVNSYSIGCSIQYIDEDNSATTIIEDDYTFVKGQIKTIQVSLSSDTDIKVEGISLDQNSATMMVGDELTLSVTFTPENATDKTITWSSDNPEVASVENGIVKALKLGSATITATSRDGNKTATCFITVADIDSMVEASFRSTDVNSGSMTYEGSYWKFTAGVRFSVSLSNHSTEPITVTGLRLICAKTNVSSNYTINETELAGGFTVSYTVTLGFTLYSPIVEFTYLYNGTTYTARAQY